MNELIVGIKIFACAGIAWRIYTYQWPRESRYRFWVTLAAYITMFLVGGQAVCLMTDAPQYAKLFDAGFYLAVLVLVLQARGNVANILKVNYDWDGSDRRGVR